MVEIIVVERPLGSGAGSGSFAAHRSEGIKRKEKAHPQRPDGLSRL